MGRPPKRLSLLQGNLTKRQIEMREQGEKSVSVDAKMKKSRMVREDKEASKHFNRVVKMLGAVEMADGLCENVINRYCMLLAKMERLEQSTERTRTALDELEERKEEMDFPEYIKALMNLTASITAGERLGAKVRDQLLAIERENMMTLQGKLRAVPKKAEKPAEEGSGLDAYRSRWGMNSA